MSADCEKSLGISAGPIHIPMLAWLLALPCLLAASLELEAPRVSAAGALPRDIQTIIFSMAGLAALYQASCVSKEWCVLARLTIGSLYEIKHGGKAFWNYTTLLRELDALMQGAEEGQGVAEANAAPGASADFACIKSILEAQFGYCFKVVAGRLPEFRLKDASLDILNDEQRISVLPYCLDQQILKENWVHFIVGLVELGRFDLLEQVAFLKIGPVDFRRLMSVRLPESVILAASTSLQRNGPTLDLSNLLAYAGFGSRAAPLPDGCEVPLYLLRYLHEKSIPLPHNSVITYGLHGSAIPFWTYVLERGTEETAGLMELALEHSSGRAKRLLSMFYEPTSGADLDLPEGDVYQAVLIRARFSPICNAHVRQNFESMQKGLVDIGYHTACAFLECKQYKLANRCSLKRLSNNELEALVVKMQQLGDSDLVPLIITGIQCMYGAPFLLQSLIRRKAEDSLVKVVWDAIRGSREVRSFTNHLCSPSLEALRLHMFGQEISIDHTQEMLAMLDGVAYYGFHIPKEACALYTLMFWEAPESLIDSFLEAASSEFSLVFVLVKQFLRLKKYSSGLCRKLIARLGPISAEQLLGLLSFRPDLVLELGL